MEEALIIEPHQSAYTLSVRRPRQELDITDAEIVEMVCEETTDARKDAQKLVKYTIENPRRKVVRVARHR